MKGEGWSFDSVEVEIEIGNGDDLWHPNTIFKQQTEQQKTDEAHEHSDHIINK